MKGDCNRHIAEFTTCDAKSKAAENACVLCAEATKEGLVVTHLIRQGTVLNPRSSEGLQDEACKIVTVFPQERISECAVEQIVVLFVPQIMDEIVEVVRLIQLQYIHNALSKMWCMCQFCIAGTDPRESK